VRVGHVLFGASAQTEHHYHTGSQIPWFLDGYGQVAMSGGESLRCQPGDVVVEPRTEHWHGAADQGGASHLAITSGNTMLGGRRLLAPTCLNDDTRMTGKTHRSSAPAEPLDTRLIPEIPGSGRRALERTIPGEPPAIGLQSGYPRTPIDWNVEGYGR
jgi:hypothetical protein